MIKLRPPDGRVFVTIETKKGSQIDAVVCAVGKCVELQVGQRICILGKVQRVEVQDLEVYSVSEANIVMIYE